MTNEKFSFQLVTEDQVREEIMNLDGSKATPIGDISVDILKSTVDIHLPFITNSINLSIEKGCFPEELKLAEVSPIFKKKDDLDKETYRPVSVLPLVSKVFQRVMYHQINDWTRKTNYLNNYQDLEKIIAHNTAWVVCEKYGRKF